MAKKTVQRLLHDSDQSGMGIINIPDEIKRKGGKAWLTVNAQGKDDVTPSAWHSEFSPEDWEDFKKNLNDNGRGITKVWIDDEEDVEDAIKDNFTPPGAKIGVDNEFVEYSEKPKAITKDHVEKYGEEMLKKLGASDEQIAEAKKEDDPPKVEDVDTSAIDEKDSGKSGEDDLDLYMKDLNDYMSKNPKGRDDIPVTTRR